MSLKDLPPEIVHQICQLLCPFCSTTDLSPAEGYSAIEEKHQGLLSLARSCKTLRGIAEPYLFNMVTEFNLKWFRARAMRDPSVFERIRFLNDTMLDHVLLLSCHPTIFEQAREAKRPVRQYLYDRLYDDAEDFKLIGQVMMTVMKSLQRFTFSIDGGYDDETTDRLLAQHFLPLLSSGSLPNLAALHIACEISDFGLHFSNATQLALIGAAPNLQRLQLDGPNLSRSDEEEVDFETPSDAAKLLARAAPGLANLQVLELTDCALENDEFCLNYLRDLVSQCPKLETLIFEAASCAWLERRMGDEREPSPAQLLDTILPTSKTLRRLELLLEDQWELQADGAMRKSQLMEFIQLRYLRLGERCFCRKFLEPVPEDQDLELGLVDLLPPWIETLVVVSDDEYVCRDDVNALLERRDKFPALKDVWLQKREERSEEWVSTRC